jgi:hypothetical protein
MSGTYNVYEKGIVEGYGGLKPTGFGLEYLNEGAWVNIRNEDAEGEEVNGGLFPDAKSLVAKIATSVGSGGHGFQLRSHHPTQPDDPITCDLVPMSMQLSGEPRAVNYVRRLEPDKVAALSVDVMTALGGEK